MAGLLLPGRAEAGGPAGAAASHRFLLPVPNIGDVSLLVLNVKGKVTPFALTREIRLGFEHSRAGSDVRAFVLSHPSGPHRAELFVGLIHYSTTHSFSSSVAMPPAQLACKAVQCTVLLHTNDGLGARASGLFTVHMINEARQAYALLTRFQNLAPLPRPLVEPLVAEISGRQEANQVEILSTIGVTNPLLNPWNDYSVTFSLIRHADGSYTAQMHLSDMEPRGARFPTDGAAFIFGGTQETGGTSPPGAQCQVKPLGSGGLNGYFCRWPDSAPLTPGNVDFTITLDRPPVGPAVMDISKGQGPYVAPYEIVPLA